MADLSTMIIASISKIWHIVPIVIGIILFKKFINNKDKKNRIKKNEENEKNGLTLEVRIRNKYEKLNYTVVSNDVEEKDTDKMIDLICQKDDKVFLFKCNNSSEIKSINDEDIKIFRKNALNYVESNDMKDKNVQFRYAIPYSDVLDKSAIKIFMDDNYNCKYVVA